MGKKKGKKGDAEKKAALQAKKEAKQEKASRKRLAKQQQKVAAESGGGGDGGGNNNNNNNDDDVNVLTQAFDQVLQVYKNYDKSKEAMEGKPIIESIDTIYPLSRANATLVYCSNDEKKGKNEYFYYFGGEYYDGIENIVLDDLLRYDISKNEWKRIITTPRPSPRCAHSCITYKQSLYIFGGEMATADEYHHYRDIWKFNLSTLQWIEIKAKNPPSARSGHATIVWKHYMIIFGGFYEAARETKWYNDCHIFNLQTEQWMDVPQSRLATKPEPRSASNIALYGTDKAIIHGGFAKIKNTTSNNNNQQQQQQQQGGGSIIATTKDTKVHTDAWVLHLAPILQNKPPTWERWMSSSKSLSSNTPNGRAGTSSISYKNRMIVYGGVIDSEQHHHKIDSIFYNDLMAFDIDRRKWFPLRVKNKTGQGSGGGRRRRKQKGDDGDDDDDDDNAANEEDDDDDNDNEDADESSNSSDLVVDEEDEDPNNPDNTGWDVDMLRANMFAFVDGEGNIVYEKIVGEEEEKKETSESKEDEEEKEEEKEEDEEKEEEKEEEKDEEEKEEEKEAEKEEDDDDDKTKSKNNNDKTVKKITSSSVMTVNPETNEPEAVTRKEPLPRINSSMVIHGHQLYILGGILEVGDREVTLDDMWSLDLRKREQWECLWSGTMHKQVWRGAIHDDDDSYISTGKEEEDDDDMSDFDDDDDNDDSDTDGKKSKKSSSSSKRLGIKQEIAELNEKYDLSNENRTPNTGEVLADFYSRTSEYWNTQAANQVSSNNEEALSNKELKREGFKLAKERYDELRPILDRLLELDQKKSSSKDSSSRRESKSDKKKSKKSSSKKR